MRPLLLDLFCGAGGAARGYHDAGFDVIGVDIEKQPNYPYSFYWGDALEVLGFLMEGGGIRLDDGRVATYLTDIDAIHASPPCQAYTQLNNNKSKHPKLIEPLRNLLNVIRDEVPYVIENVWGALREMVDPVQLRGDLFGLHVKKIRLFETNWPLSIPERRLPRQRDFLVYEHGKWRWTQNVPVYGSGGRKAVEYWPYAMGVGDTWDDCWMTRAELAEAIPPAYTEFIGRQLLKNLHRSPLPVSDSANPDIHSRCEEGRFSEEGVA